MDCRHSIASTLFGVLLDLLAAGAAATDITVVGLFSNKAVVQIDGGKPQTLSVGQKTTGGVTLLSAHPAGRSYLRVLSRSIAA